MDADPTKPVWRELFQPVVLLAALGYFVDVYDLTLFMAVREQSLGDLGLGHLVRAADWRHDLLSWQMLGTLLGGVIFGVLGDRIGRLRTLFGSILLYSLANLANAFVVDFNGYAALRFLSGIGLAGELGCCISLVSETLPRERRGYGTALVAGIGVLGAVAAGSVAELVGWRTNYLIGGGLGLLLLLLRLDARESSIFERARDGSGAGVVARGNLLALFTSFSRAWRYLLCFLIGLPTWYTIGILVQRSASIFAPELGIRGEILSNRVVAIAYLGLTFGDLGAGLLSQRLRSRRLAVAAFLCASAGLCATYLFLATGWSAAALYGLVFGLGLGMGYWALFVTVAAEQFGTNLRATVATTIPNLVRGSLVLLTGAFGMLQQVGMRAVPSAALVGGVCFGLALLALLGLRETFGTDLDYLERD